MSTESQGNKREAVKKPPGKAMAHKTKLAQQVKATTLKTGPQEVQGKVIRQDTPGTAPEMMKETIAIPAPMKQPGRPQKTPVKPAATGPVGKLPATPTPTNPLVDATKALDMNANFEADPDSPPPEEPAPVEKAASVLGDYKLLKKLGQGGMGAVYKAQQMSLDRVVAVKVLAKALVTKKEFVQRFQREARAMAKLDHPNVLRCFEVGQAKGLHYIAIEYVDGGSVEGWLKKLGRFSLGDAMHIILTTADALQHAHENSLIHRDIKPDNLLLTKAGVLKLADLGLAKDTDDDVSLTKSGAGAGTPIYMAPEQAYNVKHVDCRVDIYALGVMLYVFLTGQPPFAGNTSIELIMAKEKGKFDPIRKYNDEVPAKLDLIVDKMLAKDPKHRYASCADVIAALEPLGLASERLSFLEPPADKETTPPVAKRSAKPAPAQKPTLTPAKPAASKTRGPGTSGANTHVSEQETVEKDVWFWQVVTPGGKTVVRKVTTDQVKMLIKSNSINAQAQISKKEKAGFRAIASFPEFQTLFKSKETTSTAKAKGRKFESIYKDIDAADASRRKWGGLKRWFKGVGGFLFGLFWIVFILAVLGGGGWYVYTNFMK